MNINSTKEKEIASALLDVEAVFIKTNPEEYFTWASGIKSPIYCDNRMVLSYPKVRDLIIDSFVDLIKKEFPETELVAGIATAGIAHAALIADRLNLPMIYVRTEAKSHGREQKIEGKINGSPKTLLIEDLISTGGSSLKAYEVLKSTNADVLALLAIFTYELPKSINAFHGHNLSFKTLSNYSALLEIARERKIIDSEEILNALHDWKNRLVS